MPLNDEQEVAPVAIEEVKTETVENQPEPTPEQGEKPAKESEEPDHALKGVQKRIDRLTRQKYEAQARAEYLEKMLNERQAPSTESVGIIRENFATEAEYLDAALEYRQAERAEKQRIASYHEKRQSILEDAEDAGIDLVAFSKNKAITQPIAEAIVDSDIPVKLIAHFVANPDEAVEISKLSPARQAAAIGKLEDKLTSDKPKAVSKSAAPAPIKPVSGNGKSTAGYRPDMSQSEYVAWRRANR